MTITEENIEEVMQENPQIADYKIKSGRTVFAEFADWLGMDKRGVAANLVSSTKKVGFEKINLIFGNVAKGASKAAKKAGNAIMEAIEGLRVLLEFDDSKDIKEAIEGLEVLLEFEDEGLSGNFCYETNCVAARGSDIQEMQDQATEITFSTFIKNINLSKKELDEMFGYGYGLTIDKDYAVRFYKSKYKGEPAYYLVHSGIEYVFTK